MKRLVLAQAASVAALVLMAAKPSWAGHWEEVPLPPQGDPTYQAEIARRYHGTVAYDKSEGLPPNEVQYPVNPADKVHDIATRHTSLWGSDSAGGGHLHFHYSVKRRSIFRWVRNTYGYNTPDPYDKPDAFLYLKLSSAAVAQSFREVPLAGNAGSSVASASADGTTATATEYSGFDVYTGAPQLVNKALTGSVQRLLKYPAGTDEVEGPWVAMDAHISVSGGRYSSGGSSGSGSGSSSGSSYSALAADAAAGYNYEAQIVHFGLSVSPQRGASLKITPELQEWNGYLKQDYRLNAPGDPLVPFWSGSVLCSAFASVSGGGNVFDPQLYKWSIDGGTGSGAPYIPEPDAQAGEGTWEWKYLPEDDGTNSTNTYSSKEFHLDFGAGAAPLASTIRVVITDDKPASTALAAKAVVHWNLPHWFVTKPGAGGGPPQTVVGEHDPDKPEGPVNPDDNPDDPAYEAMQNIKAYLQARRDFIHTGAAHIKTALEIEKAIAEFYATGPLYELGGAALAAMLDKAHDLIEVIAELRAFAAKARQEATEARQLAQAGKAAGKSADEVADAEAAAKEAEQAATDAEAAANQAEHDAQKTQDDVSEAKEHNCFVAGTPILMADGSLKPIEQVQVGDLVESRDPGTGREGAKRVRRLFRNMAAVLLTLTLGNGEHLTTTPGHAFATSERGGFVLAGKLGIGQELELSHNGHTSLVRETEQAGAFPTFNFEVEGWHTYFVGKTSVWVHNDSAPTTIHVDMNGEGWGHMREGHMPGWGPFDPDNSYWSISEAEIGYLVDDVAQLGNPVAQTGRFEGNFAWTTSAPGNPIGSTGNPPAPTNWYTVITDAQGNFITAFPGFPPSTP